MRSASTGAALLDSAEPLSDIALPGPDAAASARKAGLRYVHDREPGILRRRCGRGFAYRKPDGGVVRDRATLARIRSLAIPPAWTGVWICADEAGHLQATGRDAKGRKQYRYHAEFRAARDATKFGRMLELARELPRIRAHCQEALRAPGLPREKVVAAVLTLLDQTLVRVGNEEYCRLNQSFGLTTLRDRHVRVRGARIELRFVGKSGKVCHVVVSDRRLARVIQRCQDMPGEHLFEYVGDDGTARSLGSSDVNDALRALTGRDVTAKDFRTWAGTVLAAQALAELGACATATRRARCVAEAYRRVAARLHNTAAVCRKSYVHPAVIAAYEEGRVLAAPAAGARSGRAHAGLRPEERALLALLAPAARPSPRRGARRATTLRLVWSAPASRSSARRSRAARPRATRPARAAGRTRRRRA